jgi:hypothetical protein
MYVLLYQLVMFQESRRGTGGVVKDLLRDWQQVHYFPLMLAPLGYRNSRRAGSYIAGFTCSHHHQGRNLHIQRWAIQLEHSGRIDSHPRASDLSAMVATNGVYRGRRQDDGSLAWRR